MIDISKITEYLYVGSRVGKEHADELLEFLQRNLLRGELGLDIGLQRLMRATCAYAKRQRTWFRHQLDAAAISGAQTEEMLRQALRIYAPIAR